MWREKIFLLKMILLSAEDPHTINRETLIENAVAYGRAYGITKEDIQLALIHRLEDLIINRIPR
jgi:hypothetical protein